MVFVDLLPDAITLLPPFRAIVPPISLVTSLPFNLHPLSYPYFIFPFLQHTIYLDQIDSISFFNFSTYSISIDLHTYLSKYYRLPLSPTTSLHISVKEGRAGAYGTRRSPHCVKTISWCPLWRNAAFSVICKFFVLPLTISLYSPSPCSWITKLIVLSTCFNFFIISFLSTVVY